MTIHAETTEVPQEEMERVRGGEDRTYQTATAGWVKISPDA